MTRAAKLLPVLLGLLVACDGPDPAALAPDGAAAVDVAAGPTLEIEPYSTNPGVYPVINVNKRGVITVAVRDVDGFVYTIDPMSVTFAGAAPVHDLERAEVAEDHVQSVVITALGDDGTTEIVVDEYLAFLFHFDPAETSLVANPAAPVSLCLSGEASGAAGPVPFSLCADVLVRSGGR